MTQDIRFALRLLRRNPAFSAIAIVTLALGIGIDTTAFTFFNAVRVLAAVVVPVIAGPHVEVPPYASRTPRCPILLPP